MNGYMQTTILTAMLALIAFLTVSCAPSIRVARLKPAAHNDAAKLTYITIAPFTGPNSYRLQRDITTILRNIKVDDRPFFSINAGGLLGYPDSNGGGERAGLPGTLGGYGIMSGDVTDRRCHVRHYEEERKHCVEYKDKEYSRYSTPNDSDCLKWKYFNVDCFDSAATYAFELTLREKESGQTVYRLHSGDTQESSVCNDAPHDKRENREFSRQLKIIFGTGSRNGYLQCQEWTEEHLLKRARKKALEKAQKRLRQEIAPHYVTENITLMDSDEGIGSGEAKERLKKGIGFAKNLWLLKGCNEWKEADRLAPDNPSLTYNLGVCDEFYGRFEEAAALYRKADMLSPDNRLITESIKRVEQTIEANQILNEQMNGH